MIAILSPAKDMKTTGNKIAAELNVTTPEFLAEAETIIEQLKQYSPTELASLMKINPKLAELNFIRFKQWNSEQKPEYKTLAALAYTGEAFRGLSSNDFSTEDFLHAQNALRILSALYGILRPLDLIEAYRIEMGQKNVEPLGHKSLYQFWNDKITNALNQAIEQSAGEKVLINLASVEYAKAVNFKELPFRIISPEFKNEVNGELKMVTVHTKRARGLMARFMIKHRIENADDLKAFDLDGYYFDNNLSGKDRWVFIR